MKNLRKLSTLLIIPFVLLGLLALGCQEGAEMPEEEEVLEEDVYEETSELEATLAIDDISSGTELSPDGSIDTGNTTNEFSIGDTVFVAMEVGDATAGSTVEVVIYGPDGMEAASESKNIEAGQTYMNFQFGTDGWASGEYRGEVWYNNEMMDEFELEIGLDDVL